MSYARGPTTTPIHRMMIRMSKYNYCREILKRLISRCGLEESLRRTPPYAEEEDPSQPPRRRIVWLRPTTVRGMELFFPVGE